LFKKPSRCCFVSIQKLHDVVDVLPTFTIQDSIGLQIKPPDYRELHLVVEAPDGFPSVALGIVDKGIVIYLSIFL
jgi:hypothetical protein